MRELLQQALDALINSRDTVWEVYQSDWRHGLPTRLNQMFAMEKECKDHDKAIAALEEELAKPTLPMSPEHLPQYIATNNIKPTLKGGGGAGGELAKPEQDFSIEAKDGWLVNHDGAVVDGWDFPEGTKFYTAPPRKPWVGLTDEQIQLMAHNDDKGDWSDLRFRSCWHNGYVDGVNAANDKLKELNT